MRLVQIHEGTEGWTVTDGQSVTTHHTAADALRFVRERSQRTAATDARGVDVVKVEWTPTSRIGRCVVQALQ